MNGLLTDLYELTMAAGYFAAGKAADRATFELSYRRLPAQRGYMIAAGLEQALDYLLNLSFSAEEIAYLRGLPQFARAPSGFFDYLASLRFTGDVWAVAEGTPVFPGEPILTVVAPIVEAQIAETYLLSMVAYQSLVAAKAARVTAAAGARAVVEFGTRRAHSPEAGVVAARAAFIGGCRGTSNTLAGFRYGIPVYGTAAHSWVSSFATEREAFAALQRLLGERTIYIVDTYDALPGTANAAALGEPLWGIRLDSGDLDALSKQARGILDAHGLREARIMASGDLDEYKIARLLANRAPIDAFGVGTDLVTSSDAPNLSAVYKIVELSSAAGHRFTAKFSSEKISAPGRKQTFRCGSHDVVALADEPPPAAGDGGRWAPLVEQVVAGGALLRPHPGLPGVQQLARESIAQLPEPVRALENPAAWPVHLSSRLLELTEKLRAEHQAQRV